MTKKQLKVTLVSLISLPVFLLLVLVAAFFIGFELDASPFREKINTSISTLLKREVQLTGEIRLYISPSPSLKLTQLVVKNPDGQGDFATIGLVKAQLSLLPLLDKQIQIGDIQLADTQVNLIEQGEKNNWAFDFPSEQPAMTEAPPAESKSFKVMAIDRIKASEIEVRHIDLKEDLERVYRLDELNLTAPLAKGLAVTARGTVHSLPYQLTLAADINQPGLPFTLDAEIAGGRLHSSGHLGDEQQSGDFKITLGFDKLDYLQPFLHGALDPMLPIRLNAGVSLNQAVARVTLDNLGLGGTKITGELELDRAEGTRISGELVADSINLAPWLTESSEPAAMQQSTQAVQETPLNEEQLQLVELVQSYLNKVVADLSFSIGELTGLAAEIKDASLAIKVKKNKLTAPSKITIAKVPFSGNISLYIDDNTIYSEVDLKAHQSRIGDLAKVFLGAETIKGSLGSGQLKASSSGQSIQELIRQAQMSFTLNKAHLTYGEGKRVSLELDKGEIISGFSIPNQILLSGRLLDLPFSARGKTLPPAVLAQGKSWDASLDISAPQSTIRLTGNINSLKSLDGSEFKLEVDIKRLGALANWIGVRPDAKARVKLNGVLLGKGESLQLDLTQIRFGRTKGQGKMFWQPGEEDTYVDLFGRFETINLKQYSRLLPAAKPGSRDDKPSAGLTVDIPILPGEITIMDANFDLGVNKLLADKFKFYDIGLKGSIRDGWLNQAPFQLGFAGSLFKGNMVLDFRGLEPKLAFELNTNKPDLGALFRELDLVQDLSARLESMTLSLSMQGRSIKSLLSSAKVKAGLYGGVWTLKDVSSQRSLDIQLAQGELTAAPATPVQLQLSGELKSLPVDIHFSTLPLGQFIPRPESLPVELEASLAEIKLSARSELKLPVSDQQLALDVTLKSPSLTQLNPLLGVDFPPYGPIKLAASLHTMKQGYRLSNLLIKVANSELTGQLELDTRVKPTLTARFNAKQIQLNDFATGDWSPVAEGEPGREEEEQESEGKALLTPEAMQLMDIDFKLDVKQVSSGDDLLGKGHLYWQLDHGQFDLSSLMLDIPGGGVELKGSLAYQANALDSWLYAKVDKLDYGVLAHRVKPEADIFGKFSLDLDIRSTSESPARIMENASGHLRFAVWPEKFEAGIFDLWAVSLVNAVLPQVAPDARSELNCVVGRFNMEQGQLEQDVLFADTSRMQVFGEAQVDFTDKQFLLHLKPRAKRAQIFSLETPIEVEGAFEDFGIGVANGGLLGTTLRFVTSPVISPLRWMVETPINRKGDPQCQRAWAGSLMETP